MRNEAAGQSRHRRVVAFVGNCQAQALSGIYRRRIAPLLGDDVLHVEATPNQTIANLAQLERADVIVEQKFDAQDPIPADFTAGPGALRVRFPHLTGRFYWPFAGPPHINAPAPPPPHGIPYPSELGDTLLNKMVTDRVPLAEALRRYDAAVAESAARITRMAELHLDRQRARDEACGLHFADAIAATYRQERLFTTQGHPGPTLLRMAVSAVFEAIGVPFPLVDQTARTLHATPFPPSELPVHAGVAATLGLTFVTPEQRYRLRDEASVTFAEFVERYLAHAWVPEMPHALALLREGDNAAGIPTMREALRQCPGSASAWRALGLALSRVGETEAAVAAVRHALDLGPLDPDIHATAATVLLTDGDLDGAEAAARQAIVLAPGSTGGHRVLAQILAQRGRHDDAVAVARMVAAWEPGDLGALWPLVHHLRLAGRTEETEPVLRQALALDPANADLQAVLKPFHAHPDPHPGAAQPARRYRPVALTELAADPRMRIDGQPVAQPFDYLPAHAIAVPPLAFGETDGPQAAGGQIGHPAAPAWLLRNVTVHGSSGVVTTAEHVLSRTLQAALPRLLPGARRDDDGMVQLPLRPPAGNVHTAFHLLGAGQDDFARWLLDIVARFSVATLAMLTAQPGAARAPIVLHPPLDRFWKWESLDLILPETTARMAVDPEGSLFVQRLLYVPRLGGAAWATHPATGPLFDAMRERVADAARPAPNSGRRLFVRGSATSDPAGKVLANEADLLALAERAGFAAVVPGELSFPTQIRLFAEASHVIAAHGADLAGAVFCHPGAAVCELRPGRDTSPAYRHLAAARGLRYGRLTGETAEDAWWLDPQAFEAVLRDPCFGGN